MKKVAILLSLIVSVSATQLKVPSAYSTIQAGRCGGISISAADKRLCENPQDGFIKITNFK